jgi:hypothetical protein
VFESPNISQSATPPAPQIIRLKHGHRYGSTGGKVHRAKFMCASHWYSMKLTYGGCARRIVTKVSPILETDV